MIAGALVDLIAAAIPLVILYELFNHLQDIAALFQDLAKDIGLAVASATQPIITGALIFLLGASVIGVGFFLAEHEIDKSARPPEFGAIVASPVPVAAIGAAQPYAQLTSSVAGTGGAVTAGLGGVRTQRPGGFGSSSRPRSSAGRPARRR